VTKSNLVKPKKLDMHVNESPSSKNNNSTAAVAKEAAA